MTKEEAKRVLLGLKLDRLPPNYALSFASYLGSPVIVMALLAINQIPTLDEGNLSKDYSQNLS